jgi:hypothetical protein
MRSQPGLKANNRRSGEQPVPNLRPVPVEFLGLVEQELGVVSHGIRSAATGRLRWLVAALAQQPLNPRADLRLGRLAVGPIDGEVRADALDEFRRDPRKLRIGRAVGAASGERVVERGLLDAQPQLLVTSSGVPVILCDLDEPLDDLCARDLAQLVAVQHRLDLLAEQLRLHAIRS